MQVRIQRSARGSKTLVRCAQVTFDMVSSAAHRTMSIAHMDSRHLQLASLPVQNGK